MKAATHNKYGSPKKVLQVLEVDRPVPSSKEVLINVHYSSVNRTDSGFVWAKPAIVRLFSGFLRPKRNILGCEFAGEIIECGLKVKEFKVGQRVFGFSDIHFGGHGQYMTATTDKMLAKIPDNVSYKQAAISTEGGHYALDYINAMQLKPGMKILINGATGAIGSAALQLLKEYDIHITATADTKNVIKIKNLGADVVIDRLKVDFTDAKDTYDVIFDSVGKSSFKSCRPILKKEGLYISSELGHRLINPILTIIGPIKRLFKSRSVKFPLPKSNKKSILHIQSKLADGSFKPLIDSTFMLKDIHKAYARVDSGNKIGNVLIEHVLPAK